MTPSALRASMTASTIGRVCAAPCFGSQDGQSKGGAWDAGCSAYARHLREGEREAYTGAQGCDRDCIIVEEVRNDSLDRFVCMQVHRRLDECTYFEAIASIVIRQQLKSRVLVNHIVHEPAKWQARLVIHEQHAMRIREEEYSLIFGIVHRRGGDIAGHTPYLGHFAYRVD